MIEYLESFVKRRQTRQIAHPSASAHRISGSDRLQEVLRDQPQGEPAVILAEPCEFPKLFAERERMLQSVPTRNCMLHHP